MNCGQALPDGAKFCLNCGTPQGAVSPIISTSLETNSINPTHTFVPAMCPNCNAHMKVDTSSKIAHCDTCGTECLVQDAIKTLTVRGNVQVGSATINVSGLNTDSLLQRVEIMLADGDYSGAMSKCDTILDSDPTNGKVYLFMLMSNLKCRNKNELLNQPIPFDDNQYYIKAIQYGDESLKSELMGYIYAIESRYKNLKVGDLFYCGTNNGQRMWWKVLSVRDGKALIISTSNICIMPYHQPGGNITWSDCTLRNWLNNDFINGYFTQGEQEAILTTKLNNDDNSEYKTPGGDSTTDKVFLLSIDEANTLFASNQARNNGSWWWLRSPGENSKCAASVDVAGRVCNDGRSVYNRGVRPAMWIKLDP